MSDTNAEPQPAPTTEPGGRPGGRGRPSGADRARDEMIADIDGRLRGHTRDTTTRLDQLDSTVRDNASLLAEAVPRLGDLGEAVAELTGRVDQLLDAGPRKVRPVCWPALSAEDAEKAWNDLADWVGTVLGPWYRVRRGQVPDCWALHRTVMLHLSWLHRTWLAAHTGPAATPTLAAEWHVRWLPAAIEAIRASDEDRNSDFGAWAGVCRPGRHHDTAHPTERGPMDLHLNRPALPHEDIAGIKQGRPLATILPKDDPMDRPHWHDFWGQAVATDLAWRRDRDSTLQAGGG